MYLLLCLLALGVSCAYTQQPTPANPRETRKTAANGPNEDTAAARRNENVQVNRIDNDALKEANVRLGDTITLIAEPLVETGYYATEHGRPPGEVIVLRPLLLAPHWHGELFESHQNSVFNARTFFQVGPVRPSHQNQYGGRFGGSIPRAGFFSGSFSQHKIRGMVNGNVLVPLPSERVPLATDPTLRAFVARLLASYPAELPNRPDFDSRALNTNAPQRIDETGGSLRLDRQLGSKGKVVASQSLNRQSIHAFQLIAGQNPDTEIHNHRSQLTYLGELSPNTQFSAGVGFSRIRSDLRPEPNAVPTRMRMGYQIEELGPDGQFPIDRAQNTYRWGAVFTHRAGDGRHTLTFGGDMSRFQLNGVETNNQRGYFAFTNNSGRSAIENFRMGTPSSYEVSLGQMERGFRNLQANLFWADQWKATPRLQIYYGLRYNLESAPTEVNHLNQVPYGCDCNNLSPRFGIAARLPANWLLRTNYTISFGQIPAVTYQQIRYNLPLVRYIQLQNPDLLDPLRGLDLNKPNARTVPTVFSPDLVSPYSHQYNFTLERPIAKQYALRIGYLGSRTFKLLNPYVENRALVVPGIPLTLDTVDARRPDPRYYEVNRIVNGGIAYLDAAQVTLTASLPSGLLWGATYTFSKAIDEGSDYTATAANRDLARARSQSQFDSLHDKKGLSNFDSPHSLVLYYSYRLPALIRSGWGSWLARDWQISGSTLAKTGTPLTLYIGSDAPGFGNVDGGPSERPNILDPSILGASIGNPDTAPLILRRDRFSYISPGESRGSLGRGTFRKGGIANWNAALTRAWLWGSTAERSLQFRVEAFNLTNHPQFDEPQRNLTSPAFGKITNTLNDGRVFQLSLKLLL
ncbi:MAG TPA: hypothetical protein VMZ52_04625 [Bryobacteraceae bacterium]|nr:hypothetical protein [Bryobacteraceae bacterium]